MITPLFLNTVKSLVNYPNDFTIRQNNIGILQLRRSLSLGVNHRIEPYEICMNFKDDEMCFEQYETNLIATPGTQYFLVNIDNMTFKLMDGWIYIEYDSLNKEFIYKLIKYEES